MENPENADPVYQDMNAESAKNAKAAEDEKKALEETEKDILKLQDKDPNRSKVFKDKYDHEKRIIRLEQTALYFKLRAEKRKAFDQDSYLNAFKNKKPWPDRGEVNAYLAQRRLELAPRSWDAHVPKLNAPKPEVKKAEGGEAAAPKGESKGE